VTTLAIIEDDDRIRETLGRALTARGYTLLMASTGLAGLAVAVEQQPDAVVLDLGLPDIDGLELLRMIRAVSRVPLIAATARDDEADIVRTLDAGADDYVVKPYSAEQLEARVRAVLRRTSPSTADRMTVGALVIDPPARTVTLDGDELELAPKEFDLLAYLAARAGQVVTRRELLAEVWADPYGTSDKSIDVHLSWLRTKLGETAREPRYLRVVRGVGVKLVAPD
jgi:DNA-binding response OmpR family regulator